MGWPYQQKPPMGWPLDYDSGLVPEAGFWLMNEGSGNRVQDLSGNSNIGGVIGAIWQPGKYGSSLTFDGAAGDYVDCGEVDITEGLAQITISTWFRQVDGAAAPETKYIVSKINSTQLYWSTNEYLYFEAVVTSGTSAAFYNKLTDTNWHHLVSIWDGANAKIRFDGSSVGCTDGAAQTGTTLSQAWNLYLGGRSNNTGILNGSIDNVMIWNRVLSDTEIALLYREPFCMFKDPAEVALLGGYQAVVGNAGIMTTNTGYWGPTF